MLAVALAAYAGAIDPPTLDELLEDADVEDRRRIERAIYTADFDIEEVVALEDELTRKLDLLAPTFPANAISFRAAGAFTTQLDDVSQRGALTLLFTVSIDFEAIASIERGRPTLLPGSESTRQRRCSELGADVVSSDLTALSERSLVERAKALGCEWRTR